MGIPVGIFVDNKGPRIGVLFGAFLLGLGYFPLQQAYNRGSGSMFLMCLYSFCTGFGGCCAFAGAIKTSALNWPHHRGTATAFPLAAFGLSAFFFSVFAQFVFKGSTGDFLLLLAAGTFGMTFIGFLFLRVYPHTHSPYSALPSDELTRSNSNPLIRTRSEERKIAARLQTEPGKIFSSLIALFIIFKNILSPGSDSRAPPAPAASQPSPNHGIPEAEGVDETSSLVSKTSSQEEEEMLGLEAHKDRSHRTDIRGFAMLRHSQAYFLFSLMGLLTGIGLMTINNIGNDSTALWRHYDDSVSDTFIIKRQAMHVSILSVGSFVGRLLSGVGSDFLVKSLHASRTWCLFAAASVFTVAQLFALGIQNPYNLWLVSSLTGLAYGFLFGVFPSIVAETFGIHGLSTNWGCMTVAPIISGNIFNLFYGMVYDAHSIVNEKGERICDMGKECYHKAYYVTLVAGIAACVVSLGSIWHEHQRWLREERDPRVLDREA
jgi:hypothetical protein